MLQLGLMPSHFNFRFLQIMQARRFGLGTLRLPAAGVSTVMCSPSESLSALGSDTMMVSGGVSDDVDIVAALRRLVRAACALEDSTEFGELGIEPLFLEVAKPASSRFVRVPRASGCSNPDGCCAVCCLVGYQSETANWSMSLTCDFGETQRETRHPKLFSSEDPSQGKAN